jgi:hypothetical protein
MLLVVTGGTQRDRGRPRRDIGPELLDTFRRRTHRDPSFQEWALIAHAVIRIEESPRLLVRLFAILVDVDVVVDAALEIGGAGDLNRTSTRMSPANITAPAPAISAFWCRFPPGSAGCAMRSVATI